MIGYCHFAAGEHEAAMEMCRKVAETKRIDPATGREEDCRNKWQAIYILGQVYHSLGKAVEAIREYRRVEDRSPTPSRRSNTSSARRSSCPRCPRSSRASAAEVELKFRNVAACDLKVYRIDLMKFGLLKRNLAGIAEINLAGIRPLHEATVALGDGKDYRDRTAQAALPLDREGALPDRLPRRRPARQRAGAGHAAGGRSAGRRRFRPGPHDGQGPRGRQVSPRRRREGDRQRQRGFRLRPDRSARRVRGRRHPRRGHRDRPGRAGPLRLLSGEGDADSRGGWPAQRVAAAIAGKPHCANGNRPSPAAISLTATDAADEKIKEALNSPTELDFKEAPLAGGG